MGGFTYSELAARMAEQAALASEGGGGFEADPELGGVETARATVAAGIGLRSDAGSQIIAVQDTGIVISGGATGDVTIAAQGVGGVVNLAGENGTVVLDDEGAQFTSTALTIVNGETVDISGDGGPLVSVAAGALGFYGTSPIAKQTGVAVTAEAIHAALVALGLIGA
jgi:hypothetical protein